MANSIGGLWEKTAKNGNSYYSGCIEHQGKKIYFVAFENTNKSSDKAPDFNIMPSESRRREG